MFSPDFFPTPPQLIETILNGLNLTGKVALEPSAGKGDLVDQILDKGAKTVLSCENNQDLKKILATKCKVIESDFLNLTSDKISHIDFIIMNPPFSRDDTHINHAWNIAPQGCQIVALCNVETLKNPFSKGRKILESTIKDYGEWQNIGQAFTTAERKTNVEVALIKLKKPGSSYSQEFEGFFMDEDPEEKQYNGLMPYNFIRDIVNRYVEAIKVFDQQMETAVRLNQLTGAYFFAKKPELAISVTRLTVPVQREEFKKEMQKAAWLYIFDKLEMQKHATKGLKEDINKFVEQQQAVPFTMRNIYKMLEIVIGTQEVRMDKALIEVFDKLTKHYDENRYSVEGWKTNSHYLVNRKFIMPWICNQDKWSKGSDKINIQWNGNIDIIEDLVKALCHLTGESYDKQGYLRRYVQDNYVLYGELLEWSFFNIRAYKKGTMHFEFKDQKVWELFNRRVAKIKGYALYEPKKPTKKPDPVMEDEIELCSIFL